MTPSGRTLEQLPDNVFRAKAWCGSEREPRPTYSTSSARDLRWMKAAALDR
jgi:hypothetical protein